jgi:hypothetical protein
LSCSSSRAIWRSIAANASSIAVTLAWSIASLTDVLHQTIAENRDAAMAGPVLAAFM